MQIIDLDTRGNIILFGLTDTGNSISVIVKKYIHSFYVGTDTVLSEEEMHKKYDSSLENIKGLYSFKKVDMKTIYASQIQKKAYYKISTNTQPNYQFLSKNIPMTQYNTDIDIKTRFFTDLQSGCCQWVQINKFQFSKEQQLSQYSIECNFEDIQALPDIHYNSSVRVLSFDIECCNTVGFPNPDNDNDQIITIGISCEFDQRQSNVVFQLHQAAPLHNGHLVCFDTEKDLLESFIQYIRDFDPDIICGYNTDNFDFVYFLKRCKKLQIKPTFSRLQKFDVIFKDKTIQSNQMGTREMNEILIPGRVSVDLLLQIQGTYKLRSYTLNNVCSEFLNQQKDDVYYDQITPMFNGTELQRRTLAHYCLVDAQLCTKLNQKLQIVDNLIEMAKVTGITIHTLCKSGQQSRMISLLSKYCKKEHLLFPIKQRSSSYVKNELKDEDDGEDELEGATVLSPHRGFYGKDDPISTLDFSSLYPSIIIAHNLCYTTLIKKEQVNIQEFNQQYNTQFQSVEELQNNQQYCYKTPQGFYFLRKEIRVGLLPQILTAVLAERKKVKKQMNQSTDALEKRVLNAKQLALKVTANSLYGFTGALQTGKLPSLEISSSVTSIGRGMIEKTKNLVETYYKPGDEIQCKDIDGNDTVVKIVKRPEVVYGDTDSVMCRFFVSFKDAFALAIHAANMVTQTFDKPISLSFEKVYCPYLLINKKRYAGLYFTRPEKYDKIDVKGLELIRRDNCKLVQIAMKEVLRRLLVEGNVNLAIKYMQQVSTELSAQRIDLNLLVISKAYSQRLEDYKNQNQPHLIVMQKLKQRGQTVKIGDRIPYIVIQNQNTKLFEKVEDPQYFIQNALQLDTEYYMNNQLRGPIERLLDQVIPDTNVLFKSEYIASKDHNNIFQSKKSHCCIVCGKRSDTYVICDQCRGYKMEKAIVAKQEKSTVILPVTQTITQKYSMLIHELQLAEYRCCQIQHQCITCQEMEDFKQQCSNKDCELYYARYKQNVEIRRLRQRINEFGYDTWQQIDQRKAEVKAKKLQQQQQQQ